MLHIAYISQQVCFITSTCSINVVPKDIFCLQIAAAIKNVQRTIVIFPSNALTVIHKI